MFIVISGSSNSISLVITSLTNCLTQFFVVHFVTIFTFYRLTYRFCQLHLSLAMNLDGFVSHFHGFQQFSLRHFLHFAFHHHDVLISSGNHKVHICFFELFKSRVDNELTVDTCHTYFRDRSVERNIGNGKCCRSCKSCQRIRHIYTISREEDDVHIYLCMIIIRE